MQASRFPVAPAVLAPVARRKVNDPQVRAGQALFAQAQCAACPTPA